jgi:CHAT domain-containing protein
VLFTKAQQEIRHGDLESGTADIDLGYRQFGNASPEWAWRFRILKAQVLVSRREYKKALELLSDPLPPSLASTDIAVRKNMVEGIAYRWAQQFGDAERRFTSARELAESLQSKSLSEVLNNQGGLEIDEKRYTVAEATFHRALLLARQQKNVVQETSALTDLGDVATKLEHFDEALGWDQSALQLSRAQGFKSNITVIVGNMAWSYSELGDFDNALPLFRQAAEESREAKLDLYQSYWLTGVANSYYAEHDYASADANLQQALKLARGLDDKSVLTECLNDLSAVALETGRTDLAEEYNREALDTERAGLDQSGVQASQLITARIESNKQHYAVASRLLEGLIADPKSETALKWEAEARLAKVFDDEGKPELAEKEYRLAIGTIEAARASVTQEDFRLTFISGGIEFYDDYVDFLVAHGRAEDALRVAELSRARTLTEGLASTSQAASLNTRNLRPQQIAEKMKSTVLFYWVGQERSHLWVTTPKETKHFELPKASDIETLTKSYRDTVRHMRDAQDAENTAGKQLYAMLVAPAGKLIPKGGRVIVLPDASLSALNFETLVAPDPQPHFWIEDVTVTTASSLTLLAASTVRAASKETNLLLVGNTVQPNDDFPTLAQAPNEMKMIERYFPEQRREVLEGAQATPSAYLESKPERFAYLHFVTHGTASVTRPLESAVILSKEGDSYKLYARDIVKHPLTAQLVTISACEGAGKRAYSGEGLVGLSWAFLRAGAHNVVGALWEVSDSSTPQFMDTFYGELGRGQDPASALRAAKLSLLHSADAGSVFRKPYYWAPFQLYAGS